MSPGPGQPGRPPQQPPLTFDTDPFETALDDLAGPTHCPSIPADQLPQALADLGSWVEQLVDRFAIDVRTIPPCWHRHNGMVEALSALRDHERISYIEAASPTAAVDWFRALRDIETRLHEQASRTQCTINEHRPDMARLPPLAVPAVRPGPGV